MASQRDDYEANTTNKPGRDRYATLRGYRESFSGHERNHLFLNAPDDDGQARFFDISGISGIDSPADARSSVLWDYDRDGWLDVTVINTNAPLLQIWRNNLGDSGQARGNTIAVRFIGSNQSPKADPERSNRDGFGARVTLQLEDKDILREHRCSEGLAAQNSNTMLVGIGTDKKVKRLSVRWPAGSTNELQDLPAGSLLTIYEDASQSPSGEAFVISRYQPAKPTPALKPAPLDPSASLSLAKQRNPQLSSKLVVYTSMGAECLSCVRELPYLATIQASLPPGLVAFYGLPMDPKDERAALEAFVSERKPPYTLLSDLTAGERSKAEDLIKASSAPLGLGNTIITDGEGRILKIRYGPTSVSELRSLLARLN